MGEGRAAGAVGLGAAWKMARAGDIGRFGGGSGFPLRYQVSAYQPVVKVSRASRPLLRPPDKARFGCIPGVCARIATPSAGMQGRSNAVTTFATGCYASTAALPALNGTALSGIQIPLSPLPEQRAIATVLSDMDSETAAPEQCLDKTRAIKQGMMQQLLTGSIRLPVPATSVQGEPNL